MSTQPLNANFEILTSGPFFWQVLYTNTSQHRVRQAAGSAQGLSSASASRCRRHSRTGQCPELPGGPEQGRAGCPQSCQDGFTEIRRAATRVTSHCLWTESRGNSDSLMPPTAGLREREVRALASAPRRHSTMGFPQTPRAPDTLHELTKATQGQYGCHTCPGSSPRSPGGRAVTHRQQAPETGHFTCTRGSVTRCCSKGRHAFL